MAGIFDFTSQLPAANQLRYGQPMNQGGQTPGVLGMMPDLSQIDLSSLGFGRGQVGSGSGTSGNLFGIDGLGANMDSLRLGLSGIGTLGNLWGAFQAQGLAREQLDFAKKMANTNLNNQVTSYNTALSDRARARGVMEGQTQQQVDEYVARNRMTR